MYDAMHLSMGIMPEWKFRKQYMTEIENRAAGIWKPLSMISTVECIVRSLELLGGSFLVSKLLEAALDSNWNIAIKLTIFSLVYAFAVFTADYIFSRTCNRKRLIAEDRWRMTISDMTVEGGITVETPGAYDSRIGDDTWYISRWWGEALPNIIGCAITIAISFMAIAWKDLLLASIFLVISSLSWVSKAVYEKWAKKNYDESEKSLEGYTDWMEEGIAGAATIKAYSAEPWFIEIFEDKNKEALRKGVKAEGTWTVEQMVSKLILSIFQWGTYIIVGAFALRGRLSVTDLPIIVVMGRDLLNFAFRLSDSTVYAFLSSKAMERLGEWKDRKESCCRPEHIAIIQDIRKSFGEKEVLKGASLTIEKGERIRIIGENGGGKTTLLRILTGLESADSGRIEMNRDNTAFSFQEDPIIPVKARELIEKVIATGKTDEDKLESLIGRSRLENVLDQNIGDMSEGERKKLYVALTLSRKAEFMILDEPTNHVDSASVEVLVDELSRSNKTLLVCTHDERLSAVGFDRTVKMEGGLIR